VQAGVAIWLASFASAAAQATPMCSAWPDARARIEATLKAKLAESAVGELPCELAGRISQATALEVVKFWRDPARAGSLARLRCQPASCLPFVVAVNARANGPARGDDGETPSPAKAEPVRHWEKDAAPLVKSGQKVNLMWEQGNLRLVRVMVCLDSGHSGETVRTRASNGGRVVRAEVISVGWVRVLE
jgi:hypothetical protein